MKDKEWNEIKRKSVMIVEVMSREGYYYEVLFSEDFESTNVIVRK